jgi:hypothetical protein
MHVPAGPGVGADRADRAANGEQASKVMRFQDFSKITAGAAACVPAPSVPGKTDAERFDKAVRKTFTVSKEEMRRREAEWKTMQDGEKPRPSGRKR